MGQGKDAPSTPPKAMEMVRVLAQGHEAVEKPPARSFP
jgi:starvation-inducible DNA-binding protein